MWSPRGDLLATGVGTGDRILLLDRSGRPTRSIETTPPFRVAWSPEGDRIATASPPGKGPAGVVAIFNAATGQLVWKIDEEFNPIDALFGLGLVIPAAWSPDGKSLAAGVGTIKVWDIATGQCMGSLSHTGIGIEDLSWSPRLGPIPRDGGPGPAGNDLLAAVSGPGRVTIFDARSHQVVRVLDDPTIPWPEDSAARLIWGSELARTQGWGLRAAFPALRGRHRARGAF